MNFTVIAPVENVKFLLIENGLKNYETMARQSNIITWRFKCIEHGEPGRTSKRFINTSHRMMLTVWVIVKDFLKRVIYAFVLTTQVIVFMIIM
jgi:hypothetical protein